MHSKGFEKTWEFIFLLCSLISVLSIIVICYFIFKNGVPFILETGIAKFLMGTDWKPTAAPPSFGILPMIVGSVYVTIGSIIVGVPIGVLTAVFMAFYCPSRLYKIFMILPTIIGLSESSLRSVPTSYYQGSIALGATHERSLMRVVVPAAKSGILAAIILGIGRSIGETMAVIMIAGNQPIVPESIKMGTRTMTANIVLEMAYATGAHREALIATGVVLFIFILLINLIFNVVKRRMD